MKKITLSNLMLSNVGCEIILRGTIRFLEESFSQEQLQFYFPSYNPEYDRKLLSDLDNVVIIPMVGYKKIYRGIIRKLGFFEKLWSPRFESKYLKNSDLFVSVGGDIYTMFGNSMPTDWIEHEKYATKHNVPSLMFGANMERFEILSEQDRNKLLEHLDRFEAVFVRDYATREYLENYKIYNNVKMYPDPIFSLRKNMEYTNTLVKTIGFNFTPILIRDFGEKIVKKYVNMIIELIEQGYNIELIPHVYSLSRNAAQDDLFAIMQLFKLIPLELQNKVKLHKEIPTLETTTKVMRGIDLFVGARMHGCLNALTSGTPVIFLGYSSKAKTMVDTLSFDTPLSKVSDLFTTIYADELDTSYIKSFIENVENVTTKKGTTVVETTDFLKSLGANKLTEKISL